MPQKHFNELSQKLAGHTDLNTTMQYVPLNDQDVRAAMQEAQGGHKNGHNLNLADSQEREEAPVSTSRAKN